MSRAVILAEHMLIMLRKKGCYPTPLKLQYSLLSACTAMAKRGIDPGIEFTDDMRFFVQLEVYHRFRHYRSNVITENVFPKRIDEHILKFLALEAQKNAFRPAYSYIPEKSANVAAYNKARKSIPAKSTASHPGPEPLSKQILLLLKRRFFS